MTKDLFMASCAWASLASGKSQEKIFLYQGNLAAYHSEFPGIRRCISTSPKIYHADYFYQYTIYINKSKNSAKYL